MMLFRKNKNQCPRCETAVVRCDNCHKEYALPFYQFKWCLDGTPKIPITQRLQSFHICECGMLVTGETLPTHVLQLPEYEQALRRTDMNLRKLDALYCITRDESIWLWYAHYLNEQNNEEATQHYLNKAIEAIINNTDHKTIQIFPDDFDGVKLEDALDLQPQDRLVDLYRQTKQWEKALQLINTLRNQPYPFHPHERFAFLKREERLICAHDSSIH
jgi:hypothetical protein